ncbi:MAG: DUF86 domain-containing protein [Methylacidiphilaceae bacterium]|nr:DUF86 domain-containing protein [Candidatus Methylacidiphilaceae bacterium]
MSKEPRDQDYLKHIQEAIGKIRRYVAGKSEANFMSDDLVQDSVIRNLEIIGEAATKLSSELKASYEEVPWREISAMRNRLIHGYISVNLQIVWDTVEKVLPEFEAKVESIQREIESSQLKSRGPGSVRFFVCRSIFRFVV